MNEPSKPSHQEAHQGRRSKGLGMGTEMDLRRKAIKAMVVAAMISAHTGQAVAEDYRKNPYTLTYAGAITKNAPRKVNIHPVTYKLNG